MIQYLWIVIFKIAISQGSLETHPIVKVEDGKLRGILVHSKGDKPYYAFREIPYAAPPLGDLRFAEPVLPMKWSGIRDASKNTKICKCKRVTFRKPDLKENEDCLYLNVMTPAIKPKNRILLPVYVYIFGGVFIFGDQTEYNYQAFLDEDIVVVTLGYRSALGFLSTGSDNVIPGNIGLKDQILSLKWVKRNIAQFGGDPEKVTLGGHSSGATLVGFHLLNTKAKGLFRAAILQSGSPLAPNTHIMNPKKFAYALGELLSPNFNSKNSSQDLLKLLRSVPVEKITNTDVPYPENFAYRAGAYRPTFLPVIEDPSYKNAFVVGPMHDNMANGISNHVPILLGITNEEAIVFDNVTAIAYDINADPAAMLSPNLEIKKENFLPMADEIREIYCKNQSYLENMPRFLNALSDTYFGMPVIYNGYLHSKYADVFFYQFSYKSPFNGYDYWKNYDWFDPKINGKAAHSYELPLLYDWAYVTNPDIPPNNEDRRMKKVLTKLWTNFIKYLNPTPKEDPLLQNITWPRVKQDNYAYLDIDSNLSLRKDPKTFREWQKRLEKYFESPRYSI